MSNSYFKGLDGLRVIAIIMVFYAHCVEGRLIQISKESNLFDSFEIFFKTTSNLGFEGVSIFFVLSGFLISYLLTREVDTKGHIRLFDFYVRRSLRIWPLYFAVVIFGVLLYPLIAPRFINSYQISEYAYLNFCFLGNFDVLKNLALHNFRILELNSHLHIIWSVCIEEQFYLVWPLFFFAKTSKKILTIIISVVCIALIFRFYNRFSHNTLYYHTVSVLPDLAIGGIGGLISSKNNFKNYYNSIVNAKLRTILYCITISIFVFRGIFVGNDMEWIATPIKSLFYLFIILDQAFNDRCKFMIKKYSLFCSWGRYTYSFYMLHQLCILFSKILHDKFELSYNTNMVFLLTHTLTSLLFTIIMSYISYEFYESYFLRIKRKFNA